jgi:diguanylate cyclase (GGDEF)-like protein
VNIQEHRQAFTVFLLFASTDDNAEMKGAFVQAGYESFVFSDQETLISRLQEAAPHVILFSPDALQNSLSDFVSEVLQSNPEVQLACVASAEQSQALSEYREYNLAALIPAGDQLPVRTVWAIDQICENLYRTYQNEELLTQLEKLSQAHAQAQKEIRETQGMKKDLVENSLTGKMNLYNPARSKEDYLHIFLGHLPGQAIFFKFLPTVNSFVATAAQGPDIESLKGVGSRLTPEESKGLLASLTQGQLPQALNELMRDGLGVQNFFFRTVPVHQSLDGIFIFWGDAGFQFQKIENDFLLFLLLYQQAHLLRRSEGLEISDSVTELFNRSYFYKKLDEEIARARRLEKPVSVVRMSIDYYSEIEQRFGANNRDVIIRTIGSIMKKTGRVNDFACRTEENEFTLILPHCGRKGAALRAERLRRIIEAHAFTVADLKVTISCGVSEYPSLSKDASDLDASSGKALEFIVSRGGNKVCLFRPTEEFKPDFEVPV